MPKTEPTLQTTTNPTQTAVLDDIANTVPVCCRLTNRQLMARVMSDPRLRVLVDKLAFTFDGRAKEGHFEVAIKGRNIKVRAMGDWDDTNLPAEAFH